MRTTLNAFALAGCALALALLAPARHASAALKGCTPKSNDSKILGSKNPNDIHKDWRDGSYIGTSWSLTNIREEGAYLSGVLVTPRGGKQNYRVFVIRNEWDCG